ncbi:PREDICTED: beta-D-glucosyl crocetin beta-1,6-glucosyltransferase-like [Tarenaya hassleriana]|uniref:beta-D-glucosyl crocetin beta-1,6-glucosyltransferase-like n=1 Tax=Tarenaya hassleriana TaxID=28532 RepID=UPI00053C838B|nr:PREDICTED: beta-D-glucosyl crocetin beta-1,6-glucosyltransferase-like [Tarenaya hassleriana]
MEEGKGKSLSVLMFPWLAHGHVSPFLELAKEMSERNFQVYFVSTLVNLNSFRPKIGSKYSEYIQLVELKLPNLSELPPHYHTTNGLPPHLINTLHKALDMASFNFLSLLKTLNPDLVIYDFMQQWVPEMVSSLNIPSVHFLSSSAAFTSYLLHPNLRPNEKFPFPNLSDIQGCLDRGIARISQKPSDNEVSDIERFAMSLERSSRLILVKSFRELEGECLDYLQSLLNKKMVPVGPLVRQSETDENDETSKSCIEWLDKKEKGSTVFVSFGSEIFLSAEDIEEIAFGLELSGVNFIWVIRFPSGEEKTTKETLPKGFTERVNERGIIIEKWAPQARILRHESVGGFLSHCGWSSIMESLKLGVPIIASPVHNDQPVNAKLVEEVGVGMEVKRNEKGGFERKEIAKVIEEVVKGNGHKLVKKRAAEMSDRISKNGDKDIDKAVEVLRSLCEMGRI